VTRMGSLLASKSISRTDQGGSPSPSPSPTDAPAAGSPSLTANRGRQKRQQRLMASALILLVITLVSVLYHDRDFWFPDQGQNQDENQQTVSATATANSVPHKQLREKVHGKVQNHPATVMAAEGSSEEDTGPSITTTRTVLPPLEVEVIAGESHHKLRPGSNTVQVDLSRGSAPSLATPSIPADPEPIPAAVTSKAAEHVRVSSSAAIVTHSVTPDYPTLARQMKVQGSVVLQAVIGRNGMIEDLQIVSGPPILAGAAREAVKQWHFKPHYLGAEPVETQAKITVNFTISTN
jgi:TonB family protein